jgi:hypothetical protein
MMVTTAPATCWPEPDSLDAANIDHLLVGLRDRREALLDELRGLELRAERDASPAAFIDLVEARVGLNALMQHWRGLLARALQLQNWAPLGSEAPRFADIRGDDYYRAARALVPLTPDSLLFVHGPVILWHAAALAEELLAPGDRLCRMTRSAFHRELTTEPRIVVWDCAAGTAPPCFERDAVSSDGVFETVSGRALAFAVLPSAGHPPASRAGWHPMTAHLIASSPSKTAQPAAFSQPLTPASCPGADSIVRGSDVLLAKAEAFVAAITQNILVGERVLLLSRAPNFAIDENFGAWLATEPELQFEIDWQRQKPIPGRGAFVPVRYRRASGRSRMAAQPVRLPRQPSRVLKRCKTRPSAKCRRWCSRPIRRATCAPPMPPGSPGPVPYIRIATPVRAGSCLSGTTARATPARTCARARSSGSCARSSPRTGSSSASWRWGHRRCPTGDRSRSNASRLIRRTRSMISASGTTRWWCAKARCSPRPFPTAWRCCSPRSSEWPVRSASRRSPMALRRTRCRRASKSSCGRMLHRRC